jgi:uncharacterized membrane protein
MDETESLRLRVARRCSLVCWGMMLLGLSAWQLTRPTGPAYFLWMVQLLPLVIFIPALWRGNPRAYIGLCFVLLLYFIKAVEGVFSPARAWIDFWLLGGSVVLFISAMLTSRWLQMAPAKE